MGCCFGFGEEPSNEDAAELQDFIGGHHITEFTLLRGSEHNVNNSHK